MKATDPDLERYELKVSHLMQNGRAISRLPLLFLKLKHYKHLISSLP